MPACVVKFCKSRSDKMTLKTGGITFHKFPKCPDIKEQWIRAIGNWSNSNPWLPTKNSTICSKHFESKYFNISKQHRRRLLDDAIPTICLPQQAINILEKINNDADCNMIDVKSEDPLDEDNFENITDHYDTEDNSSERMMRKQLFKSKSIIEKQKKKIKRLFYERRKQENKIVVLEKIIIKLYAMCDVDQLSNALSEDVVKTDTDDIQIQT